jgi:tetratricopeptide (TPR) repeat protein/TolB-like protein
VRASPVLLAVLLAPGVSASADRQTSPASDRLLVMPFENVNREARLYWLVEGSSVLVSDELARLGADAITRDERLRAFERLQLPPSAVLSDATVIKVGRLLGATEVVTGTIALEGNELTVKSRSIRLEVGRLTTEVVDRGALTDMPAIFERVARRLRSGASPVPRREGERPPLPALEDYIKGLVAETPASQTRFLEAALAAYPSYAAARVALWQVLTSQGDHARALQVVLAMPEGSPAYRRSRFLAALSEISGKQYDAAYARLKALAGPAPSAAVFNNLGVVQVRRGSGPETERAAYYFAKAMEADRHDPDYYFNLGYAYWLDRDPGTAVYWLREAVRRNPVDGDAHFVLGVALRSTGAEVEGDREKDLARRLSSSYAGREHRSDAGVDGVPRGLERLKQDLVDAGRNLVDTTLGPGEQRDQRELVAFHLDRGRRLFADQNDRDAITDLKRAVFLSPYQAEAHLLLGRIFLRNGQVREGIEELKLSLWSEETVEAHLALAEAYWQARDLAAARAEVKGALSLDPNSEDARKLLDKIGPEKGP